MNEIAKKLPFTEILGIIKRFRFVIFLAFFAFMYAYLLLTINSLGSKTPKQSAVDQELQTVKRLKVDQAAVNQMLKLTEENIEINTLYKEARDNPFIEGN